MRQIVVIFFSVFLAELGDKTQLATVLFATDQRVGKMSVFIAAATALTVSTLLAVVAGEAVMKLISPSTLKTAAGVGFIAVGIWTLIAS